MLSYLRVSLSNSPRDKETQLLQLFPTSNLILPKLIHHFIVLSHRDLERQFRFFSSPPRIVSFATSATEEQYCEMDLCKKRAKIRGEEEEEEEMDPQPRRDRRNSRPIVNGPPRNDGRRGCQRILLARILFPLREASPPFFPFLYLRCYNNPRPLLEPRHEAVEPWNSLTLLQQAGIFEGISTRPKNSESLSVFPRWGTVAQKFYRPLLIFPPSLFISFRFVLGLFPLRENFNNACVLSINEDF